MSAFMGLSPNNDLKNRLIGAESVFMTLYMIYIMLQSDLVSPFPIDLFVSGSSHQWADAYKKKAA